MRHTLLFSIFFVSFSPGLVSGRPADTDPPTILAVTGDLPAIQPAASGDTTWFGGTRWDPVDARWEALPDSVWTFESGVASTINLDPEVKEVGLHSLMEGWVGVNRRARAAAPFPRRSQADFDDAVCVGDSAGALSGEYSFWAGLTQAEAESVCFAAGQGYGSNWDVRVGQTFPYSGGQVQLTFDYVLDVEPGFDYVYVFVDTTGSGFNGFEVWQMTGSVSGAESIILSPGLQLPSTAGDVTLGFYVMSDGAYDDQDGIYDTICGAFAVDNVALTGGITHSTDFESGSDGWVVFSPPPPIAGEWSDVQAVVDLPVVAGSDSCSLGDSVLTFIEGRPPFPDHSCFQRNVVVSPWIDLGQAGMVGATGYVVEYDGFFYLPSIDYHFIMVEVQWYPDTCPVTSGSILSQFTSLGLLYRFPDPWCTDSDGPLRLDFSGVIPANAERVRLAVGATNESYFFLCEFPPGQNTTPWFDNIRFGVFDTTVTAAQEPGVGSSLLRVQVFPNPSRGRVKFRVSGTNDQSVRVSIFDLAGRLVRRLADLPGGDEARQIHWDGLDDSGRPAGAGIYFVRAATAVQAMEQKIVLLR